MDELDQQFGKRPWFASVDGLKLNDFRVEVGDNNHHQTNGEECGLPEDAKISSPIEVNIEIAGNVTVDSFNSNQKRMEEICWRAVQEVFRMKVANEDLNCIQVEVLFEEMNQDVILKATVRTSQAIYDPIFVNDKGAAFMGTKEFGDEMKNKLQHELEVAYDDGNINNWYDKTAELQVVGVTLCGNTAEVTVSIPISSNLDTDQWKNENDFVQNKCLRALYALIDKKIGNDVDKKCIFLEVEFIDKSHRRRLLETEKSVTLKTVIILDNGIYQQIFIEHDGSGSGSGSGSADGDAESIFSAEFVDNLKVELAEAQKNGEIAWYDAESTTFGAAEIDTVPATTMVPMTTMHGQRGEELNVEATLAFYEDPMQLSIPGILLLAAVIGIFGWLNSCCRGADNFGLAAVLFFGLYTWVCFM